MRYPIGFVSGIIEGWDSEPFKGFSCRPRQSKGNGGHHFPCESYIFVRGACIQKSSFVSPFFLSSHSISLIIKVSVMSRQLRQNRKIDTRNASGAAIWYSGCWVCCWVLLVVLFEEEMNLKKWRAMIFFLIHSEIKKCVCHVLKLKT